MCESNLRETDFWAALCSYRTAQAKVIGIMAKNVDDDGPMNDALEEYHLSIVALLSTPIGVPHQFFSKLEVVEELIAKESTDGVSAANYPLMAISSLKRDLLGLKTTKREELFSEAA